MEKQRTGLWLIVGCIILLVSACASPGPVGSGGAEQGANTVTVSGRGQIDAQPDVAVATLGVQTQAEEADVALNENNENMTVLLALLQDAGVADEDVQTQSLQLWPRYEETGPGGEREVVGYTALNTVQVRVREIDSLGELLDRAVEAGGNRIEGIRFEFSDPSDLLDQARDAAWEDALHKAEQLADLAGAELGPVSTIEESSRSPVPVGAGAIREQVSEVPVAPGSETVEVNLRVSFQLAGQAE